MKMKKQITKEKRKTYKEYNNHNYNMFPSDLFGSLDDCFSLNLFLRGLK